MTNKSYAGIYSCAHRLNPGSTDKEHLRLLVEISKIRSDKVANALGDYFVLGGAELRFVRNIMLIKVIYH